MEKLEINSFAVSQIELGYLSHSDSTDLRASVGSVFLEGKITPDTTRLEIDKIEFSDINLNAELKSDNINARLLLNSAVFEAVENRREYSANIEAAVKKLQSKDAGKNFGIVINDCGLKYMSTNLFKQNLM
jgi:hypothetical protein